MKKSVKSVKSVESVKSVKGVQSGSSIARSLLSPFFLITQSDRVEVCGGQGLCTALRCVALADSEYDW